ncbi:MAG: hypothetical protein NT002_03745 [candidate division Zixibacteria bacterium]|nr:hypothetical protein [candidate division Zixibacteria bacterium]
MKNIHWLLAALLFAGCVFTAQADVVIKKKSTFGGVMGFGAFEATETEYLKADRCSVERVKAKGKGKEEIQITRLDKELLWDINPDKRTYKETPLASLKELMAQSKESQEEYGGREEDYSDTTYEWTVNILTPDGTKDVNGFGCRNVIGKAIGVNKKDSTDKIRITYDFWLAKDVPGMAEMEEFYRNYAKVLGIDEYQAQQGMSQMTGKYATHFGEMSQKIKEAGGFPIKVSFLVEKSGGEGSGEGGEEAAKVMGKIGGLFGKKQAPKSADGMTTIMSFGTEVLGVEAATIDAAKFEVPTDYKKK